MTYSVLCNGKVHPRTGHEDLGVGWGGHGVEVQLCSFFSLGTR